MMRQLYICLLFAAAACAGCQNSVSDAVNKEESTKAVKSGKLEARLGTAKAVLTTVSVMLSFTVINDADTLQRFCKWETPFEPTLGKYFEIIDEQGKEVQFTGAMARRVMPPPPESYIEVPANDSVRTIFNLADKYSITSGQYTVKYTGGGVSGLEGGNEIKIAVVDK